uniref:Uncharacterized protein n=1 Tax=Leersia perrieri TaxID=77586 RepID=A0A0D9VJ96_9ORYZ
MLTQRNWGSGASGLIPLVLLLGKAGILLVSFCIWCWKFASQVSSLSLLCWIGERLKREVWGR